MNRSRWFKNVGFASLAATLGACDAQSHAFPTAASPVTHAKANEPVSSQLLYAAEDFGSSLPQILVFSYPRGKLLQTISGLAGGPQFICSDRTGDVFVPTTDFKSPGYIYEFAHAGTQPVEMLTDPGPGYARACSVDPTTGNLAVANEQTVAVYPSAQGTPMIYQAPDITAWDCAYDDSGNLFVDGPFYGDKIAELPAGGTDFSDITLSESPGTGTGHLQWWNNRLVLYGGIDGLKSPYEIYQVRISGSRGIVSGPVLLYGKARHHRSAGVEFALSNKTIVMPEGPFHSLLDLWHYPKGGKPYELLNKRSRHDSFYGVAISE